MSRVRGIVVLLAGGPDPRSVAVARDLRDEAERPGIMFLAEGGAAAELCLADDYVPVDCTPAELVLRVEVLAPRRALSSAATSLRAGRIGWSATAGRLGWTSVRCFSP